MSRDKRNGRVRTPRSQTKHRPPTAKDQIFINQYILHRDHNRAYVEAGFKYDTAGALRKAKALEKHIQRLMVPVEKQLVRRLAYEREDILDAMAQVGLTNAQDYIHQYEFVYPPEHPTKAGRIEMRWGLKPLHMLTREQAFAVEDIAYNAISGVMTYSLPSLTVKHKYLQTLGENTKALNPQNPQHLHQHVHLHGIPTEKLRAIENELVRQLGVDSVRDVIGLTTEDQNS